MLLPNKFTPKMTFFIRPAINNWKRGKVSLKTCYNLDFCTCVLSSHSSKTRTESKVLPSKKTAVYLEAFSDLKLFLTETFPNVSSQVIFYTVLYCKGLSFIHRSFTICFWQISVTIIFHSLKLRMLLSFIFHENF